ncbi:MAG TPA: hypothetical protein VFG95_07615 [Nitrospiria bacterium]|nr:hypothetical protein [Nitrospiria bacterium]
MAKKEKEYRRLPGRGTKRGSFSALARIRASLWQGKDHLLCLYSTGYTEDYKRFYYRDIQAIVTQKTPRGALWNGVFLVLIVLLVALAYVFAYIWYIWTPSLGSVPGFFSLLLIVNWLRGPTCVCHLQTRVSKEELPSLNRLRTANKVIGLLRPLIEGAQGSLSAEEIAAKSLESAQPEESARLLKARIGEAAPPAKEYDGRFHEALFCLLLLEGTLNAIGFSVHHVSVSLSGSVLSLLACAMVIVALTKQHEVDMGVGLKSITWSALVYLCGTFVLGYLLFMSVALKNPVIMNDNWKILTKVASLSPSDSFLLKVKLIFSIGATFSIGTSGLLLVRWFRRMQIARSRGTSGPEDRTAETGEAGNG